MSPRPPDFTRLFADGAEHDYSRLREGCVVTIRIAQGADLRLPSGRLMASEPWSGFPEPAADYAFVQRVPPGVYPVELLMADFYDPGNPQNTNFSEVAAARVVVLAEPVAHWSLALQPGQDDADLAPDEIFGYPVDGGMGSFSSPEFMDVVREDEEAADGVSDASFDLVDADEVGEYVLDATGDNIVMFRSGGGDGRYGTWVGYTAAGEVACFLTEFLTLEEDEEEYEDEYGDEYGDDDDEDGRVDGGHRGAGHASAPSAAYRRRGPDSHATGAHMLVGQTLRRQSLTSPSGLSTLVYQDDGNLVLYRYDREWAVWASNTQGASVGEFVLQEDGNLVLYNLDGRAVWASNTVGRRAERLSVWDDGVAVLQGPDGAVLWSTDPAVTSARAAARAVTQTSAQASAQATAQTSAQTPVQSTAQASVQNAVPGRSAAPGRSAVPGRSAAPAIPDADAIPDAIPGAVPGLGAVPGRGNVVAGTPFRSRPGIPLTPAVPARPAMPAIPARKATPATPATAGRAVAARKSVPARPLTPRSQPVDPAFPVNPADPAAPVHRADPADPE